MIMLVMEESLKDDNITERWCYHHILFQKNHKSELQEQFHLWYKLQTVGILKEPGLAKLKVL